MFQTATQSRNTARLVMSTFNRIKDQGGVTPADITRFLRWRFGGLWRNTLTQKAEQTLNQCVNLGFLERRGNRFILASGKSLIVNPARVACGLSPTRKTRCRDKRSVGRRARRSLPPRRSLPRRRSPPHRRLAHRRRPCAQGRVRKKRCVRVHSLTRKHNMSDDESGPLEPVDDDDGARESSSSH